MNENLEEIIEYFDQGEGYSKQDVITDLLAQVSSLKGYAQDEIALEWGEEHLTYLDTFANEFYDEVIEKVCNVIKSFKS